MTVFLATEYTYEIGCFGKDACVWTEAERRRLALLRMVYRPVWYVRSNSLYAAYGPSCEWNIYQWLACVITGRPATMNRNRDLIYLGDSGDSCEC